MKSLTKIFKGYLKKRNQESLYLEIEEIKKIKIVLLMSFVFIYFITHATLSFDLNKMYLLFTIPFFGLTYDKFILYFSYKKNKKELKDDKCEKNKIYNSNNRNAIS